MPSPVLFLIILVGYGVSKPPGHLTAVGLLGVNGNISALNVYSQFKVALAPQQPSQSTSFIVSDCFGLMEVVITDPYHPNLYYSKEHQTSSTSIPILLSRKEDLSLSKIQQLARFPHKI